MTGGQIPGQAQEVSGRQIRLTSQRRDADRTKVGKHPIPAAEKSRYCVPVSYTHLKAVGVDEITKKEYERNLEQNIDDLVERLKRKSYKPQPSIRVYIRCV